MLIVPMVVWFRYLYINFRERTAMSELMSVLFPEGASQREPVVQDLIKLTKGKYNRIQLLDYFLKIKGLHLVDLHTSSSRHVRMYLMRPTKIKLNYSELVQFYEKYLNLPQATGIDATIDF
ncbi:MAG: hypothetical protein MJZ31_00685 [Bacteroidales bacterium]|nr:hypothetical protein [Bacteroidales bacterium]